ncbi:MAG: hypothetical protein ACR2HC_04865, partial [Thermoleophilaceae bacterium]
MDTRQASGESFLEGTASTHTDEERGPIRPDAGVTPRPSNPGASLADPAVGLEPPSTPDGTFVKVRSQDPLLPRACEV